MGGIICYALLNWRKNKHLILVRLDEGKGIFLKQKQLNLAMKTKLNKKRMLMPKELPHKII